MQVASGYLNNMASTNGAHGLPPRPHFISMQSNSVPTTPHQHAHDFGGSRSRSPSPHGGLGSHSPRSVVSEANGSMAALPRVKLTCGFEKVTPSTRRRMQYSIGDALLDPPAEEPKSALDPDEEKKLTGDMRELYDRLLPSPESEARRLQFVKKLDKILHTEWPGNDFTVLIFGSSGNLLCTNDSDVDICIQTPMKSLETMHPLAEALHKHGMEDVHCVPGAKVPIVKMWDPELSLAVDMNVNNTLALENTRMIKTYVQIDERVRPLAMIIKHWTKQRILNDAGIGGTLSSYTWICMILNFLQTRDPPILPALHQMPHKNYIAQDGSESGFADDLEVLSGFGSKNTETIGELLFAFFRRYGYEIDYAEYVVSVRHGRLLSRKEKSWEITSKEGQWRLCVEEPFNTTRNLGNSADSTAFRGIHLEIRNAFQLISEAKLGKCCELYTFPPEEKPFFKKPNPGPKPVLSSIPAAPSHGRRNGGNGVSAPTSRNTRMNGGQRGNGNYRRASSAGWRNASFVPNNGFPYSSADYAALQDQIYLQSQMYNFQIEQIRARMVGMAAYQSQVQAAEQVRNVAAATAHAHSVVQGSSRDINSGRDASREGPSDPHFMNGNHSVPYASYLPQFPHDASMMGHSASQEGSRTNPSSPSLTPAMTARRGLQRSSVSNGTQSGSLRSQSQPARSVPQQVLFPGYPQPPPIETPVAPWLMAARGFRDVSTPGNTDLPVAHESHLNSGVITSGEGSPKEYLGYEVSPAPISSGLTTPAYGDYTSRKGSADLNLPPHFSQLSRSPSPLGHQRTYSTPLHTPNNGAMSHAVNSVPIEQTQAAHPPSAGEYVARSSAPLVVNGSNPDSHPVIAREGYRPVPFDGPLNGLGLSNGGYSSDENTGLRRQQSYESNMAGLQSFHGYDQYAGLVGRTGLQYDPAHLPIFSPSGMYFHQGHPHAPSITSEDSEPVLSPKSNHVQMWRPVHPIRTSPTPETPKSVPAEPKQGEVAIGPGLSPVMETRTPSPTVQRLSETLRNISIDNVVRGNGNNIRDQHGINGKLPGRVEPVVPKVTKPLPNHQGPPGPGGEKTHQKPGFTSSGNAWTSTNTKKKGRKRSKSMTSSKTNYDSRGHGEPLPFNESERKGG
ncbi:hypothetical protein EJ06DRAFT_521635 [Trichodelitschia bisporula]|uniref:polynucleotide adenylyltransferase n=1 Tax=Trichodelitschia bisporula TaxID=703511 RepID=A0A6G1HYU8_9PEZI|nr:hypothetical protein EJ06DRAFT_521635 [Trichodelitschia bisporula]